jgi:hypothetical protein
MAEATPFYDILVLDEPPTFTVDVGEVEVSASGGPGNLAQFENASINSLVQPADNLIVQALGIQLPYHFTVGTGIPYVEIGWAQGANEDTLLGLNGDGTDGGSVWVPGGDPPLGSFIPFTFPPPFDASLQYELTLRSFAINISMIGVDASLDATSQEIQVWLRVAHTFALQ